MPGGRLWDISHAVQAMCEAEGYGVVREFVGHGIGKSMHEDPQLPNYGDAGKGPRLRAGMVLAIEPMINLGGPEVRVLPDGWTAITVDGSVSAHFEHTVAINQRRPADSYTLDASACWDVCIVPWQWSGKPQRNGQR